MSDTAFRGFGGPQGMFAIEYVLDDIARALGRDPLDVRRANLYGTAERNVTPYGMTVEDNIAPAIIDAARGDVALSRAARGDPRMEPRAAGDPARHRADAGQVRHLVHRDALQPGRRAAARLQRRHACCSITAAPRWARACSPRWRRSSRTSWASRVARVRVSASDTSKVPNAAPTAASSGSDLNGMAARDAARKLKSRLAAFAAAKFGTAPEAVVVRRRRGARGRTRPSPSPSSRALAYMARDADVGHRLLRDAENPLRPQDAARAAVLLFLVRRGGVRSRDRHADRRMPPARRRHPARRRRVAQSGHRPRPDRRRIPAGLRLADDGRRCGGTTTARSQTHSPSTYKIPTAREWPEQFRIDFFDAPNREDTIHRSKAVGEPPLMLALSAFHAIRDAIASVGDDRTAPRLDAPANGEAIWRAVCARRRGMRIAHGATLTATRDAA